MAVLNRYRRNRRLRSLRNVIVVAVGFGLLIWLLFFRTPRKPRRAVIMASFIDQNVTWAEELPADWEIYRYVMDDPFAELAVPIDQGREAMAYATYIIDHYDDLPDYMVFIHGHDRAWHSVEPMVWKLEALNYTALDKDHYISLRCAQEPTANPKRLVDLTKPMDELGPQERLIPWFWGVIDLSPTPPDYLAFPCCAQFAVTKKAVRARSYKWWIGFRDPLLHSIDEWGLPDLDAYKIGILYEKLWHVAFGKPPVFTPDESYCYRVQWSDAIHCGRYLTTPFWWSPSFMVEDIHCRRNENPRVHNFKYRIYSGCNETDYEPDPEYPVWYSTDPSTPEQPREHPCPG